MIFTKDCGKIPVWLLTVPCEENNDDDGEGENPEEAGPSSKVCLKVKFSWRVREATWLN